jgi:hypothetical protein
MAYERVDTVKVKDPDNPSDYIVVNASDWGDGRLFSPDDYPVWGTPAQRSTRPPASVPRAEDDEKLAKGAGASAAPVKR